MTWRDVNNMQAGCMGMCPETLPVYMRIHRNSGGVDSFIQVY